MSDGTEAPAGAGATALAPAMASEDGFSPVDLGKFLTQAREQKDEPAERANEATAETELAAEANAAPAEKQATGETQEADPAEKPPLELPRSWTKDRAEYWNKLDPDTQEFLLEQDRKASAEVRRVQNDAAEKLKGLTAKEQQAEQARQNYEARQADYTKALETALQADFGDIQSLADVRNLQANDPFRFQAWQVRQLELSTAQAEKQQVDQRKAAEANNEWTKHVQTEDAKFAESLSEADKAKIATMMAAAPDFLEERGFNRQELLDMWNGKERLSLRDHRVQSLILDGLKYRDIQKAKVVAIAKPAPPVQRPGASKPAGTANSDTINKLSAQLERSGDTKDLGALIGAMRRA